MAKDLNIRQKDCYVKAHNKANDVVHLLINSNGPFNHVNEQDIVRNAMEDFWKTIDKHLNIK
jgi:hypothetical protein